MIVSAEKYNEILSKIHMCRGSCVKLETELSKEFELPKNTISSIISIENKKRMKKTHYKMGNNAAKLFDRYLDLKSSGEENRIILKIANESDVSYTLLAKLILEKCVDVKNSEVGNRAGNLKMLLKDSTLLEEKDLAYEVFLCQLYDSQYGSINDMIRHCLGQEYEYHLQKLVKEKRLSFQSENDLRIYGYDKTPDIKLDVPFAVDGFVVNWIESKALFADVEEHQNYTRDQYSSYWNRFGTGLVIYWLGMVETVIDSSEKRFIVRNDFPDSIKLIDPLILCKIPFGLESK